MPNIRDLAFYSAGVRFDQFTVILDWAYCGTDFEKRASWLPWGAKLLDHAIQALLQVADENAVGLSNARRLIECIIPFNEPLQYEAYGTDDEIRASGGWVEVYYYVCPEELHTHWGYGIDDPLDRDLAPSQRTRNETYFANLMWDVTRHWRFGLEATYRKTARTLVGNNEGAGLQMQVSYKF